MLDNLVGLWMRKDSLDDNHSYPSISTPRRHFETLVRTRLLHYKLENWLSIYSRGLFQCLIHFTVHVACYVRWWWQRKSVYTQTNKNTGFFRVLERVRYLRKEHQSIKWNNVDMLPLLFQIVLGNDSSYDSSYNRSFHGFFQPFGMDKLRMIHLGLR